MVAQEYKWPENEELVFVRPLVEEYHGKLPNFYNPENFPVFSKIIDQIPFTPQLAFCHPIRKYYLILETPTG